MSKASEGDGASRATDYSENGGLELVHAVDDLPDRIILGEEFRSGKCAGDNGGQNSGDKQETPMHDFVFWSDEDG